MEEGEPASPGAGLRPGAPVFEPQQRDSIRPIKTAGGRRDVFASLDAVCFTPSQGVCTPSPTNMAAMWAPQPFHHMHSAPGSPYGAFSYTTYSWEAMTGDYGSPGPCGSNSSDVSHFQGSSMDRGTPRHAGSRPHTPTGHGPLLFSSFYYPVPFSPTALQMAAAGGFPGTPTRSGGYAGGPPGGAPFHAAASPGQAVYAQTFGTQQDGAAQRSMEHFGSANSDSGSGSGSGSDPDGAGSSSASGIEVVPGAHQLAAAMLAAQNLQGCEPPQQLLELASLLQTYGLVSAGVGAPAGMLATSPDAGAKSSKLRTKSQPKLNPDGSVRLNARQRRTLRRAQERAMKALVELQQAAHGVDVEQATATVSALPMLSVGAGSPPPPEPPIHSAAAAAAAAAAAHYHRAGPSPIAASPLQQLHPMSPAYVAAGMLPPPQAMVVPAYGLPPPAMMGGAEAAGLMPMPLPMPLGHVAAGMHSPMPAPRGTPGGGRNSTGGRPHRLSRFAPQPYPIAA